MRKSLEPSGGFQLSESLVHRLNLYALGATAAGVGMLACAQPAEARIIYTPAHVSIGGFQPLDLNNDGKADFYFRIRAGGTSSNGYASLAISRVSSGSGVSNKVVAPGFKAIAFKAGEQIGPRRRFESSGRLAGVDRHKHSGQSTFKWYGQWGNNGTGLKNRYLGLRFFIHGKLHYGWARVSVFVDGSRFSPPPLLTGYAYETTANKPIVAGAKKSQNALTGHATLGHLAAGALAISSWR